MLEKIVGRRRRGNRGWHGWKESVTWLTCVWTSSGSWWCTEKLGMLQSLGSQRVRHSWATELKVLLPFGFLWCHNLLSFFFLIFFTLALFLFFSLLPWFKCLSILLIYSKNPFLFSSIFSIVLYPFKKCLYWSLLFPSFF